MSLSEEEDKRISAELGVTPGEWRAARLRGWGNSPGVTTPSASVRNPIAKTVTHSDVYYRQHTGRTTVDDAGCEWRTDGPETPEGEARAAECKAEQAANARLMAASKEMLALLERARDTLDSAGLLQRDLAADIRALLDGLKGGSNEQD